MTSDKTIGFIFDCDGTLLDSMGVWRELDTEFARLAGVTLTPEQSDMLTAMSTPESAAWFHEALGLGASNADVERMITEFMRDYYGNRAQARAGAVEFVDALARAGAALSVASSTGPENLRLGLRSGGFLPYFDGRIVSVEDVGRPKRWPDVYHRARELMSTALPATWGVEDAAYAVRTLRRANYHALAVYDCDESGTWEELAAEATLAARSFVELNPAAVLQAAQESTSA